MGGCTNCKGKSGCDDRKGPMMASVEDALARLYPTRVWGEPEEIWEGLGEEDLSALADELATELRAATFVELGGDDEPCDYIWILSMGRTPCVMQSLLHGIALPDEWRDQGDPIDEMYIRVVVSQRVRVAACQQIAVQYVPDAERSCGIALVRMQPRAGVYDAPLLHRMQKLVAILPAYELMHVDFGDIAHAPPGFEPGVWRELYGGAPSIANYLFFPQPTTMITTRLVESEAT
jgi:hypothetical protein